MQFVSLHFCIFFALLILLIRSCKKETQRQYILLFASYIFYACFDIRFLILLFIQTAAAYLTGQFLLIKRQKWILAAGIFIELLILGFFKYFDFFIESFSDIFNIHNTLSLRLILPVGISFYTFQALSYMIDVYRKALPDSYSFKDIALYIGFFPQIVSGPIVKAHDFLPQLKKSHSIERELLIEGAQIFLMGVFKKYVMADRIGVCVDAVYNAPAAFSWLSILIAILSYSVQIYCDFSGYSDMAIGIAKMLGFDLGKNFNCPYLAKDPSEFWKRWHISLSSWFKEYVYIPLGGNRKGSIRTLLNLMIVMLLSGLWHGAAWTYVIWGALHGFASILHRLYSKKLKSSEENTNYLTQKLSVLANFIFVSLTWVFFRASSIDNALAVLKGLFTLQAGIVYIYSWAFIIGGICLLSHIFIAVFNKGEAFYINFKFKSLREWFILWLVLLLTLEFFYIGNTAFIYAQF